jgi:hypothetical protein
LAWLWEPATKTVCLALAIPRAQDALAGGTAEADATEFELRAERGSTTFGICSGPFLDQAFLTKEFRIRVTIHPDGRWSYDQVTELPIRGRFGALSISVCVPSQCLPSRELDRRQLDLKPTLNVRSGFHLDLRTLRRDKVERRPFLAYPRRVDVQRLCDDELGQQPSGGIANEVRYAPLPKVEKTTSYADAIGMQLLASGLAKVA